METAYERVVRIVGRLRHQDAVGGEGGFDEVVPAVVDHDLGALTHALSLVNEGQGRRGGAAGIWGGETHGQDLDVELLLQLTQRLRPLLVTAVFK